MIVDYMATEKLNLNGSASITDAEAGMSGLFLTAPDTGITDPVLEYIYDFEAVSVIEQYSDLHYQQIDLEFGGTYQFTPALYVAANIGYQIFKDKDPYVYGDLDGDAYQVSLGLGYSF